MKFKLIAVDLDGTLLDSTGRVPLKILNLLERMTFLGGRIVIATGRGKEDIYEIFSRSNYRMGSKGYPHGFMSGEIEIYYLKTKGYVPDREWNFRALKWFSEFQPLAKKIMDEVIRDSEKFNFNYERRGEAALFFEQQNEAIKASRRIQRYLKEKGIEVLRVNRNGIIVALIDFRLGKGNCLERIAKKMDIYPNEVVAIGDSGNDISMLNEEKGFFPACVGNADAEVKELVKLQGGYIATRRFGYGVAEIISKVVGI